MATRKKRKSRKQLPGVLAYKRASKKLHAYMADILLGKDGEIESVKNVRAATFGLLVARNMEAGLTPAQAMAAAKNGVWVLPDEKSR